MTMTSNNRIYSKQSPEKDITPQKIAKTVSAEVIEPLYINDIASEYQKPSKEILPKAFFVVIAGGEVRERDYLKYISNSDKFNRIIIDFIADPNRLSPKGMLSIAQYKKAFYLTSQEVTIEVPDKIFIISDVDDFMTELLEIRNVCLEEQLHLIISNSCFEVWLYYAYRAEFPSFPIPSKYETISWKFKRWLPSIVKGGINPGKALLNIKINIDNAKANYKVDKNGIPELFSTNMFELAEEMLPLIEPELSKIIEENRIREIAYRNHHKSK